MVTTIGYERTNNPALQFKDEIAFIDYVLFTAPPEPVYYPRMKKENLEGPVVLNRLPTCPPMAPKVFEEAVSKGDVQLVDNRQMLEFGGGHIAGALNIGPRAELSIWAGWMLDPQKPVFLVLPKDTDVPEVQRQFIRVGYYNFGGYLLGGMEEWNNKGLPISSMAQMSVHELKAALPPKDLQIVDVRTPGERQDGYIPGSTYIFLPELAEKAKRLDKSRPVAVYCDCGYRASLAASLLLQLGFKKVHNVPGSWKAWKALDFEVQTPKERKKGTDTDLS